MQVGLLLLLAAQTQSEVELEVPKGRQGFHLGIGLRSGAMGVNADGVGDLGLLQGGVFNFRFGQMATNLYGFGLSIDFGGGQTILPGTADEDKWVAGLIGISVLFQLSPFDKPNISFHAAIGPGAVSVARKEEDLRREDDPSGAYGALYTAGITYDWFPFWDPGDSGGFAVTTVLEGRFFPTGDIIAGGFFIGVEIEYWFGFEKNRLALDVDEAYKR